MGKNTVLGIRSCHRHLSAAEHEGNREQRSIRKWVLEVLWHKEQHASFFLTGNLKILQNITKQYHNRNIYINLILLNHAVV